MSTRRIYASDWIQIESNEIQLISPAATLNGSPLSCFQHFGQVSHPVGDLSFSPGDGAQITFADGLPSSCPGVLFSNNGVETSSQCVLLLALNISVSANTGNVGFKVLKDGLEFASLTLAGPSSVGVVHSKLFQLPLLIPGPSRLTFLLDATSSGGVVSSSVGSLTLVRLPFFG